MAGFHGLPSRPVEPYAGRRLRREKLASNERRAEPIGGWRARRNGSRSGSIATSTSPWAGEGIEYRPSPIRRSG
jgi:hypothetical protein